MQEMAHVNAVTKEHKGTELVERTEDNRDLHQKGDDAQDDLSETGQRQRQDSPPLPDPAIQPP